MYQKTETSSEVLECIKVEMNLPRIAKSARTSKRRFSFERAETLLKTHRLHLGLYERLADRLGVDASYISKVAGGTLQCQSVMGILLTELAGL